jgi:hypothetical protein
VNLNRYILYFPFVCLQAVKNRNADCAEDADFAEKIVSSQ